jgi:hypothetical protein
MTGSKRSDGDQYSPEETQRRFEAAVRVALRTPPKPHSEMKIGKRNKGSVSPREKKPNK